MSTRAAVVDAPPAEALELNEAVHVALEEAARLIPTERFQPLPGSVFDAQGRVPVIVIRPGIGKGRGRHLYEARMLEENAHKFQGWKMFIDHLSPDARRAAGGLPRSVRDLGGRLTETWWEPSIPADPVAGHPQGAVVGLAKPVPYVRELIENDPEIIESSISASATAVRPVTKGGERVWLVEGIEDRGSLDWVTEAGAGGRVIPLLEAAYADPEMSQEALVESMSDAEILALLESRPQLREAMTSKENTDAGDGDEDDELKKKKDELVKKGLTPKMAEKVARRRLRESREGGAEMADITPEALKDALAASPNLLVEALTQSSEAQLFVTGLVEAKVEEERELSEARADEKISRVVTLSNLEKKAHKLISESKLPESWQDGLREKFELSEAGEPTDGLDVTDEVDDEGKVVKAAKDVLAEAVNDEIKRERRRLAEANPTMLRGQGGGAPLTDEELEEGAQKPLEAADVAKTGWGKRLQEAGVDPAAAYGIQTAGADA